MYIYLQLLVNVLEFIAFCLVIYNFKLLYHSPLRLLIFVIPFIFFVEALAVIRLHYFGGMQEEGGNINYYNYTTLIILLIYYALFFENIHVKIYKKIFLIACIVTISFYLFNISFIQKGHTFHTYSFTIGSVCLCLGIIFYIKEIVESEKIIFISKVPLFWISVGLFSFYIINIPYMGMYNFLVNDYIDFLVAFFKIGLFLNYFMYCCIIKGLLCLGKSFSV